MNPPVDVPPQPVPDPDSAGFWDATAQGHLAICRCAVCRTWIHPPLERCRACGGPTTFDEVTGSGTVHAYIVMHRASIPGQGADPYVIVEVDLDDAPGVRLSGRLVAPTDAVRVGDRVTAAIVPVSGGPFHQSEFRPVRDLPSGR